MNINVKLLTKTAIPPTRGTAFAAGLDLYADESVIMASGEVISVSTGISVCIPDGYVGIIKPRSGLAFGYGVDTMAGVIDSDYRGELRILLTCTDLNQFDYVRLAKGDRIAQLLIIPVLMCGVDVVDELDDTERGGKGLVQRESANGNKHNKHNKRSRT